jgi:hypothetical protein
MVSIFDGAVRFLPMVMAVERQDATGVLDYFRYYVLQSIPFITLYCGSAR